MNESMTSWSVSLLRITVGWHFLYEGLVKLLNPGWTAVGYLANANWIFSEVFHHLANSAEMLQIVNFLTILGLILIGSGLMLGLGIRLVAAAGIALLLLFYIVNPALIGAKFNSVSSEGSYLIINKNIIEALALLVVLVYPPKNQVSLWNLWVSIRKRWQAKNLTETQKKNDSPYATELRRSLIQSLLILPMAGAFTYAFIRKKKNLSIDTYTGATTLIVPDKSVAEQTKEALFSGTIAGQTISRLIMGGGCLSGWQHARDLAYVNELASAYNSGKRIFETFKKAETLGINTVNVFSQQMPLVQLFRNDFEGTIKAMVAVAVNSDDIESEIGQSIELGADMIYIQPFVSDRLIFQNEPIVLDKAISYIRKIGLPAGIGCFSVKTVEACISLGIKPDFYVKSIHPDSYWSANPMETRNEFDPAFRRLHLAHNMYHDNIFDLFSDKTKEIMATVKVPWIGFKTLASGAVFPDEGFRFAYEGGADFISVGMFDFQLERNIKSSLNVLKSLQQRKRKWYS